MLHDVTGRRAAERGLEESNARFKQLAESIEEVFWLTDIAKQRIIYISPGYEKIWGRTCQSVIDDPSGWLEAIHPDDRAAVRAALEKQAGGKYDEEYRVLHTDGTTRWVHDKAFPVRDESGAVIGVAAPREARPRYGLRGAPRGNPARERTRGRTDASAPRVQPQGDRRAASRPDERRRG